MSQPGGYQYQPYQSNPGPLKAGPSALINGEPIKAPHVQNGTISGQSSRDPSREPSRNPSPTHQFQNQYRPQMPRPPMPPINGQQTPNRTSAALPPRMGPAQNYSPAGTPPLSQNIQPNIGVSTAPTASVFGSPYSSTQPSNQPIDFHSLRSSNPNLTQNQTQLGTDLLAAQQSNQNLRTTGQVQPSFGDSTSDSSNVIPQNDDKNTTATVSQASNLSQFPSSGPTPSQIRPNISQMNRSNLNMPPVPQHQNERTLVTGSDDPTEISQNPSNVHKSSQNANQSTNVVTQLGSNQPLQSSFFSTSDATRTSTQNIFAPANPSPVASVPSGAKFSTQPPYSNTQNLFGSTQNLQSSSRNAANPSQNVIPSASITQHSAQTPNLVSQPNFSRPPMQYVSPTSSAAQYSNPYSSPLPPLANPSNLPGPPKTVNPNQNTYGTPQNLSGQRKYPQGGYGIQPPMATGNMSGPVTASQASELSQTAPVGFQQYPTGLTQPGMPPLPGHQPQNQFNTQPQYPGQLSNVPLDNMAKRYPNPYPDKMNQLNNQMSGLNVTQAGFNKIWGMESIDLLQCRNVLPAERVEPPKIKLQQEFLDNVNCSPDIFRCTLTKIPETSSLLKKSRLPLGVLIHPFKDLHHLPVIQCSTIVRCRACRTYINPFVYFVDSHRWKCNLCYRVNELPEEFQFDPVTKSYGDPSRRPEVKTSTIEFIAPSEYMLRPPQPAVYLFVFDVSRLAVESGYLSIVCRTIIDELSRLPGDSRTQVGFLAVDSALHFFSMPENVSQPHEIIMLEIDDVFIPCPDNLIVNLKEREELIVDLLMQLPNKFDGTHDTNCALGAGLQAAFKLMSPTGGRVTVFQTCLPNVGPGSLQSREDPNNRSGKEVPHLNPATDFYKRIALDCSGQQIAVDLFLLNSQYSDMATLSGMCKFSGGCIYHVPLFRVNKPQHNDMLERMVRRYLTRKIGFEAVMRIRCTRGLSIDTFHGNFFVRSTDLLSLPNINPDAGFGMQVAIEENLSDVQSVCFQAALLYTSSKGERRIRVHTLCLPVVSTLSDVLHSADQQCIIGLLAKMAVDRSQQSSLSDARDALINVAIDVLSAYKLSQSATIGSLLAPTNLKLLPLYIIALLKCIAFRSGTSTRLDDRLFAMCQMKALPLSQLIQSIYPDLYPIHALSDENTKEVEGKLCPQPPRLHLSAEKLDSRGVFLLDIGDKILIYVGKNVHPVFCSNVLGFPAFTSIPEEMYDLPELETAESEKVRNFIFSLQEEKPYYASIQVIRDDSHFKQVFTERLIEDRIESALSYYEFLQHLKTQVK